MPSQPEQAFIARVAARIAAQRREAGVTQEELADRMNTATRNIQRIESGEQNLTLGTVARLAEALGIVPEELVGGAPSEPARPRRSGRRRG